MPAGWVNNIAETTANPQTCSELWREKEYLSKLVNREDTTESPDLATRAMHIVSCPEIARHGHL
jgi:hypothetical protein